MKEVIIKLHNMYIGKTYATKDEITKMENAGFTVIIKKGDH